MNPPPPASNDDVIRNRLPYSPITDRPILRLPGGARVAVWTIVNVEVWDSAHPMPRTVVPPPMGQPLLPDVPNWAWHEYGMRVGFGRFLEVLGARGLRASFAVNGAACEIYPQACKAAHEAGWDFVGHGFMQRPMHRVDDQPGAIRKTIEAITALTGKPPRGWESPGLTETNETLDHLAAARHRVCVRLVPRRPTRSAALCAQTDRRNALYVGDQRRHDFSRSGTPIGRDRPARNRPIRSPLPGRSHSAANYGDFDPSLSHRGSPSDQIS